MTATFVVSLNRYDAPASKNVLSISASPFTVIASGPCSVKSDSVESRTKFRSVKMPKRFFSASKWTLKAPARLSVASSKLRNTGTVPARVAISPSIDVAQKYNGAKLIFHESLCCADAGCGTRIPSITAAINSRRATVVD